MGDTAEREELEASIWRACDGGHFREAARVALVGYGPEIVSLLVGLGGHQDGADAYSIFLDDLWRGLPGFRWQCSFRTWAYKLARHALYRTWRDRATQARRRVALSDAPELAELAERVRTSTLVYLRTDVKDRFVALRDELAEEDRVLLVLRVDRRLTFDQIAVVMAEHDAASLDPQGSRRESARLRQRFRRVKARLATLAARQGLL